MLEQLANLLKNIKANLHNKAKGQYREMAWLPFHKSIMLKKSGLVFVKMLMVNYHNYRSNKLRLWLVCSCVQLIGFLSSVRTNNGLFQLESGI